MYFCCQQNVWWSYFALVEWKSCIIITQTVKLNVQLVDNVRLKCSIWLAENKATGQSQTHPF